MDKIEKPYFAKCLPVEGEIKEGSTVRVTANYEGNKGKIGIFTKWFSDVGWAEITLSDGSKIRDEDFEKVKLFLCSRDIQIGDKFTHKTGATETEQVCLTVDKEKNIIQDEEHNFYMLHFCHKVIGEISPDATWVKEGDEFDEYEESRQFQDDYKLYIKLKGPCGRYH